MLDVRIEKRASGFFLHHFPRSLPLLVSAVLIFAIAREASAAKPGDEASEVDSSNPGGVLRTITLDGKPLDTSNPFFQSLGSNGRSCVSCHVPSTMWTITPAEVQDRFRKTEGLDPIFRTNDGANSPLANVATMAARRQAYSMLLKRGVIRVGMPIPANAEFDLVGVDDPYQYASAAELSLFRRPIPTTNLRFLTAVMWDGRESSEARGTFPIRSDASPEENAAALFENLMHQANSATVGHAQGPPLTQAQRAAIAQFELNLASAQRSDRNAGLLSARGVFGGPEYLAQQLFYVTINDVLGEDVVTGKFDAHSMPLFDGWASSNTAAKAAIARGAALFGANRIDITDVGGLNDDLGFEMIRGSCSTCHDSPNVGNHSVALPIDIGLTNADFRTSDMPLYTLRNRDTGATRQTTDPGLALITGRWKDISKFKGPVLRGLAARAPFFHNGSAPDLRTVLEFYEVRFGTDFTEEEKADLIAFLNAL